VRNTSPDVPDSTLLNSRPWIARQHIEALESCCFLERRDVVCLRIAS
jgi:hypothetical protein